MSDSQSKDTEAAHGEGNQCTELSMSVSQDTVTSHHTPLRPSAGHHRALQGPGLNLFILVGNTNASLTEF